MTLDVRADNVVASSLALLLVDVLDVELALPGDLTGGDRSTNELISTLAAVAGDSASDVDD